MNRHLKYTRQPLAAVAVLACVFIVAPVFAQSQIMGQVEFSGMTKVEKTSGVWIDGQYVGYMGELKGGKRIMLLPGDHELSVRQAGYQDFTEKIVVEPRLILTVRVKMQKATDVTWPSATAELKVNIKPDRAAVFVDDKVLGHAGELGGAFHSMLLSPGKHRIKVELPGYQTFESDVEFGHRSEIRGQNRQTCKRQHSPGG